MSLSKELRLNISDPGQHAEACASLLDFAGDIKVFAFEAPMGSGKTTFIKSLCQALGVSSAMSSPTYSIVNEYDSSHGPLYHFDLYRIRDMEELFDLGFEEYADGRHYCFIEWPELALPLLERPYVRVAIEVKDDIRQLIAEIDHLINN